MIWSPALALLFAGTAILCKAAERPARLNIIIMMADDMGLGDTSAYLGKSLGSNAKPKPPFSPMNSTQFRSSRPFRQKQIPSSL